MDTGSDFRMLITQNIPAHSKSFTIVFLSLNVIPRQTIPMSEIVEGCGNRRMLLTKNSFPKIQRLAGQFNRLCVSPLPAKEKSQIANLIEYLGDLRMFRPVVFPPYH